MSVLCVPAMEPEGQEWPSLGPALIAWIEKTLVFGPGDLRGKPARIDQEKRALIERAYEVYPREHEKAGRRRFKRVAISLRKGSAKTELAAWLALAELHPGAPVRCVGWSEDVCPKHRKRRGPGECCCAPVGGPVKDPFIPVVAYTEEQSEELCYGAMKTIAELAKLDRVFDIGLERIMRLRGDGKALAVSTAPGPRDGARTTFQVFDETHRFVLPRLRKAHQTMLANMPKRKASDAWSLETTTAPAPGENSVAESTMHYADAVAAGRQKDSRLFFFHRQANDGHALDTPEDIRAAVIEASGPVGEWSDIDSIVEQWADPTADRTFLERVWLNRLVRASERAFNVTRWKELSKPDHKVSPGALIALGFDGSRYNDATGLIGTEIETGFQFVLGKWERPADLPKDAPWEVPQDEVEAAVREAFERYEVWRLYADPPYWETCVSQWSGEYGEERVVLWPTNRHRKMAEAVHAFVHAQADGSLSHDGDADYARHIGNAHRKELAQADEDGKPLFVITKERPMSPLKIDLGVAGILSWQARLDAVAAGVKPEGPSIWDQRAERDEEVVRWV